MDANEFVERFRPIRNSFDYTAPLEHTMFDRGDEEQSEYVERFDPHQVWSYHPEKGGLINGMHFGSGVIGYVVCKENCMHKPGSITISM